MPNLIVLGLTVQAYELSSAGKIGPLAFCLSRSLKVIGTEMDRSATCDFLLVIISNHEPILYHFQDIARNWPKNCEFFHIPAEEFFLEFCNAGWAKVTRMIGLLGREKGMMISIFWYRVRRMDRQTKSGRQLVPRLRIASRAKKIDANWYAAGSVSDLDRIK